MDAVAGGIFLVNPEYWEVGNGANPVVAIGADAACRNALAALEVALARNLAPDARESVERARRVAVREQGERQFDECLEAIDRVRPLLGQR